MNIMFIAQYYPEYSFFISAIICPILPGIDHGHISYNSTTYKSKANITCEEGYRLINGQTNITIHCQSNAEWSYGNLSCHGN